jgi:SagB-type dehydrogenase family enzyme
MAAEADISLPLPRHRSDVCLEETLLRIKSLRRYSSKPLTLPQLSQLLWAAQGIKNEAGKRTCPSAGATYPLEVYAVVGDVTDVPAGIYHYQPQNHSLKLIESGDRRQALAEAASQRFIATAPVSLVIAAVPERTASRYGQRAVRYIDMEAGHAAQNIGLQAVALGLGTLVAGAFDDAGLASLLKLDKASIPLYIIPVGGLPD